MDECLDETVFYDYQILVDQTDEQEKKIPEDTNLQLNIDKIKNNIVKNDDLLSNSFEYENTNDLNMGKNEKVDQNNSTFHDEEVKDEDNRSLESEDGKVNQNDAALNNEELKDENELSQEGMDEKMNKDNMDLNKEKINDGDVHSQEDDKEKEMEMVLNDKEVKDEDKHVLEDSISIKNCNLELEQQSEKKDGQNSKIHSHIIVEDEWVKIQEFPSSLCADVTTVSTSSMNIKEELKSIQGDENLACLLDDQIVAKNQSSLILGENVKKSKEMKQQNQSLNVAFDEEKNKIYETNQEIASNFFKGNKDRKVLVKEPNFDIEQSSLQAETIDSPLTFTINLIEKPRKVKKENSCASTCWH